MDDITIETMFHEFIASLLIMSLSGEKQCEIPY